MLCFRECELKLCFGDILHVYSKAFCKEISVMNVFIKIENLPVK